ncbi:uncharacterized protein PAC_06675 [Phialocephala subalpina]|uniref:Uncharacterized protein n=1 Tax=Phialocephala subalpina TaxID=576137 RepID=A0A1L7WVH7_9HELO|nr:uncharacterized protein PAC_06675 [Phialocephala subalpina]
MGIGKEHIDDESKAEGTAKRVTKRKQIRIDAEPTEVRRGYPQFLVGGRDHDGRGKVYGVIIGEKYIEVGYVSAGEECIDTGPNLRGLTVINLEDGKDCMIDGAIVRLIR